MKKLSVSTYLLIRDIPAQELVEYMGSLSDISKAVILLNLKIETANQIMDMLKPAVREKVVGSIVDLDNATETVIPQVMEKVEKEITSVLEHSFREIHTKKHLAALVSHATPSQRSAILMSVKDKKASYFTRLIHEVKEYKEKNGLVFFEDILNLNDADIIRRISRVDFSTLSLALSGASEGIRNKILDNVSERVRQILQEEMNHLAGLETDKEKIDAAQQEVGRLLMKK